MAGILNSIQISSKGLSVQRARMDAVAQNIANAEVTQTPEDGPYRRRRILVAADKLEGGFEKILHSAKTMLVRTHEAHAPGKKTEISHHSELSGVQMKEVKESDTDFKLIYDPTHPDADGEGYVKMPNIEVITEMVDMMLAARAYEANTTAIAASKKMITDTLDI